MNAKNEATGHGLGLWWTILLVGCVISAFLNIWHALHQRGQGTEVILGLIFAVVPVGFAAMLSHGLVSPAVDKWFKAAIVGLFGISMLTSIASQAAVLEPYGGDHGAEWSIPIVLDASALLALHYITKIEKLRREAAARADMEADLEAIREQLRPDIEADIRRELEEEMAAARADMEADIRRTWEADIARIRADIEADIRAEKEADIAAMKADMEAEKARWIKENETAIWTRAEVETEARIRREMATASKAQNGRKVAPKPTSNGMTSEDKARLLLSENPEMTGAELGRALGLTDRQGRRLLDKLTAKADMSAPRVPLRAVN